MSEPTEAQKAEALQRAKELEDLLWTCDGKGETKVGLLVEGVLPLIQAWDEARADADRLAEALDRLANMTGIVEVHEHCQRCDDTLHARAVLAAHAEARGK